MFSVNNFYDYLTHKYSYSKESVNGFFFNFETHGSRDLYSICATANDNDFLKATDNLRLKKFIGINYLLDQEPIEFHQFDFNADSPRSSPNHNLYQKTISKFDQITMHLSSIQAPIICHSEQNSAEITVLKKRGFLDVHYWWHGLISRDWFRHWKHYTKTNYSNKKRFGCYIRDTSGTRQYRKSLLNFIKQQQNIFCPMLDFNNIVKSDSSAKINWSDTDKFDIQIVPETLFETQKTHLTEKSLRPMAMYQPFIIVGAPNSLEYLRQYGFKTFNNVWDESYDQISDPALRLNAIKELIQNINSLELSQYKKLLAKTHQIIEHNQVHLYSSAFEEQLLTELENNFNTAFLLRKELFLSNPRSTWLDAVSRLASKSTDIGTNREHLNNVMFYMLQTYPKQAKQIIKTYSHLF
jgi:hypothetical protein